MRVDNRFYWYHRSFGERFFTNAGQKLVGWLGRNSIKSMANEHKRTVVRTAKEDVEGWKDLFDHNPVNKNLPISVSKY